VVSKGDAFWWEGHVWIVLSDPSKHAGEVLCVNLTTLDDECPDDECILHHSDYPWIEANHPTAVAFSRSRIWRAERITAAIKQGLIKTPFPKSIPDPTMAKIAACGKSSRELSGKAKRML
jgi:hypothetical protein